MTPTGRPRRRASSRHPRTPAWLPVLVLAVLLALLVGVGVAVKSLLSRSITVPPPDEGCTVTVGTSTSTLTLEQARFAAIITGESIRRGLAPRAASIALATAMQESGLRNLDYGDRDSVGLFQQRPSQGWGTTAQIMDPWYASGRFYAALVKVADWQTGDINDVAQEVQKSGVPDGYRKHVEAARIWASALTGQSAHSVSCISRATTPGNAKGLGTFLDRVFTAPVVAGTGTVTLTSSSTATLWAAAQLALAGTSVYGVNQVAVGALSWTNDGTRAAQWTAATPAPGVQVTVRT